MAGLPPAEALEKFTAMVICVVLHILSALMILFLADHAWL